MTKMKKYIYLLTVAILASLTGCYDNDAIEESLWVADLKTLPATFEGENSVILHGETKMETGHLYFMLSQSEDFSDYTKVKAREEDYGDKAKYADVNKWQYIGKWYYKLAAITTVQERRSYKWGGTWHYYYEEVDKDIYDVANVETFTVENPLKMLSASDVTWNGATLNATSSFATYMGEDIRSYFSISGPTIDTEINATGKYTSNGDGTYTYSVEIPSNIKLEDSTEYTVRFYQYLDGVYVGSEPTTFTTGPREATPLQIAAIEGYTYDLNGNRIALTEDLSIVIMDSNGYAMKEPLVATWSENKNQYEFKNGNGFNLQVGHTYAAAIFKNKGTYWRNDNGWTSTVWYGDAYAEGIDQDPIYFGNCEKLTIDNPYIKANLSVKTAQVRVRYPATWGECKLTLLDSKKQLPSFEYGMDNIYMYGPTNYTSAYLGQNNGLTADGKYYEYVYNIWPVSLSPNTHSIRIDSPLKSETIAMPSTINLKSDEIYTVTIYANSDMSVDKVTVTKWDTEETGGTIVIN